MKDMENIRASGVSSVLHESTYETAMTLRLYSRKVP
jgi:hypothetical protein